MIYFWLKQDIQREKSRVGLDFIHWDLDWILKVVFIWQVDEKMGLVMSAEQETNVRIALTNMVQIIV